MPTLESVMADLKAKGTEKTRTLYARHDMPAHRSFGVSNADLKLIAKTIKREQALAMELYATGNLDAMYLAGIVADGSNMSRKQLQSWAEGAAGMHMIYEYPVPWVTVESEPAPILQLHGSNRKRSTSLRQDGVPGPASSPQSPTPASI
jgi:hypothetical protein